MAKCSQSLIPTWLYPGLFSSCSVGLVILSSFGILLYYSLPLKYLNLLQDVYLHHMIVFTFLQALLSTFLSLFFAIPMARALWHRQFLGRELLIRLCTMTSILPFLVAIFGLVTIYGYQGWLAKLWHLMGYHYLFSPYGLSGILLAHMFFNIPLAIRFLLIALDNISIEQRRLSDQLNMSDWYQFWLLEWPYLKQQSFNCSALIFVLCFTSFTTILVLGGGPQSSTISIAIYQSLHYDYNLQRAATLALLQLLFCLPLLFFSQKFSDSLAIGDAYNPTWYNSRNHWASRTLDIVVILLLSLFIIPPLLAIIIDGINEITLEVLWRQQLWQSVIVSLKVALSTGVLAITLAMMLLWSQRELLLRRYSWSARAITLSSMLTLVLPGIVLATGFFLLLRDIHFMMRTAYLPVIICNTLLALPYTIKILQHPMYNVAKRYNYLCTSLQISGINRLRLIELKILKKPLTQGLAFASVISLGDFSIIALFGNPNFSTLPFYLYEQLASYRSQSAAISALVLLIMCFLLFSVLEHFAVKEKASSDYT